MHILLAGNGKMAAAIRTACNAHNIKVTMFSPFEDFNYSNPDYGKPVAIHVGSGSQLLALIEKCQQVNMPLIQGSTKLSVDLPIDSGVFIVKAPNFSIPMLRFMAAFPKFACDIMPGMKVGIVESHQEGKKDVSGTARAVAKDIGVPIECIQAIRNPAVQLALGVPQESLNGHAHHYFIFTGGGAKIAVSTEIQGRETYAEGALVIAQAVCDIYEPSRPHVTCNLTDILHILPKE
jgi:dihydrodipicolinate reductase